MEKSINRYKQYMHSLPEIRLPLTGWYLLESWAWWRKPAALLTRFWRSPWFPLAGLVPIVPLALLFIGIIPRVQELAPILTPAQRNLHSLVTDTATLAIQRNDLEREILQLENKLKKFTPRSSYLVINTTSNTFRLYAGDRLEREGKCSTGSLTLLSDGKEKKWYFETPKGIFKIRHKTKNPVWKKPDWAFVEEGLPIPPANHHSRIEYGSLGDYALSLGDGYLIHGTLYQRFLGMPVTHGCIRMGDEDLEFVFRALPVGSSVYIY